jgi:hypothetical protein
MVKKKAKKAKAVRRRRPNKELWASAEAKRVLSAEGELTMNGLKLIVENQREINTSIYRALKLIAQTRKAGAGSSKVASDADKLFELAEAIPGPGFPGCSD